MTTSTEMEPWKEEPLSPVWLEIDDLADYGDTTILDDIDLIIKEEPQFNSGWTDGGSGCYSPEGGFSGWVPHQTNLPEEKTSQLLQEFEDVLSRALTPPDSPQDPLSSPVSLQQPPTPPVFFTVQPAHQHVSAPVQGNNGDGGISELDALVAESLGNGDCSSCSGSDSGYEDPDWAPGASGGSEDSPASAGGSRGGRGRPYPSVEERRARKKEQNKNAATRYRQKKKQEVEVILAEESTLQEKNDRLKVEMQEMQREIKYLKSLMRHMFKAKGIIH